MAIHAATVGILIEKGRFEPEVALGVAEAIDLAMTQAQFVTVPVLDARIHEIKTELRVLAEKVDTKLDTSTYKADMQRFSAEFNAKLTRLDAKLDTKLAELEARLVRWVFLVMVGNVALSLAANTLMNAFKSL